MSLAQRFERRLEGVVGSAFARVFKGQVEPVEIGNALQREAGDKRAVMPNGQVLAPNRYRVSLGTQDYERLVPWEGQLCNSLAELVQEYLDDHTLTTVGDIEVYLHHDDTLHTGVFGVASRMEAAAPPRQRPYDSLSLPVVPGLPPGQYEHPFGSPAEPAPSMPAPPAASQASSAQPYGAPSADPYGQSPAGYPQPGAYSPDYGQPQPDAYAAAYPQAAQPLDAPPPDLGQPQYGAGAAAGVGAAGAAASAGAYGAAAGGAYGSAAAAAAAPQFLYGQPSAQGHTAGPQSNQPYAEPPTEYQQPYQPPAQAARAPRVGVFVEGSDAHLILRNGSNVIGRGQDCDLQLFDQGVSRRHVDIQYDGRYAVVYDLGSTNGTAVNGQPIGSHQLRHGDVLRIGHSRLVYQQENG